MKKLFTQITILSGIFLLILSSCKKDETQAVADMKSGAQLKVSSNTLVLKKDDATKMAVSFEFTEPDFGYKAAITNVLQLDKQGSNFATPKEMILDAKAFTKSFTVIDLNAILLSMGLPTSVDSKIEARIKSSISATSAPTYSNVIPLTVNVYPLISFVYVPGAYQGWNPATAETLISPTSNNIYEGIINFTPDNLNFKILTKRSWGPPEYGKGASDGLIAIGGGDIAAPGIGFYKLTADLTANTLLFTPYSFGVIGDATPTGWDGDTDMVYDNATQTWSVTIALKVGAIKFRLNNAWEINYGGSNGTLNQVNDNNIPITAAGTYKVSFSIPEKTYTLTKQ